jgi:predicted signal transduction protein with EAL and GGDEF domain
VVAEGVETAEQLMTLRQRGCDVIQGYFFSRPVDAKMASAFLRPKRLVHGGNPISLLSPTIHAEQLEFATVC